MVPEAFDIVCDKIAIDHPSKKHYKGMSTLLEKYYNPFPLEIMENFIFRLRKQRGKETVQDCFFQPLEKIGNKRNFGTYLSTALRNELVVGIGCEMIQGLLLEKRGLSLGKAVELAGVLEQKRDQAKAKTASNPRARIERFVIGFLIMMPNMDVEN